MTTHPSGMRPAAKGAAVAVIALVLSACSSSQKPVSNSSSGVAGSSAANSSSVGAPSSGSPTGGPVATASGLGVPVPTDKETITWAVQGGTSGGLGSEAANTAKEIAAFEAKYPNITVKVQATSGDSADQALAQLKPLLASGSSTPDLIDSDQTWVGPFAKAGWVAPLDSMGGPSTSRFFPGQLSSGEYNGHLYALPWFTNAEGLYYRSDLVPTPPTTPAQVVTDAQAAMKADPSLKMGFAWEGAKYEGAVTALMCFVGGFGGTWDVNNINAPQVVQALQYMHDLVYTDKVTPQSVVNWQEGDAHDPFINGQAVFSLNWPFQYADAEKSGSVVSGKTAWIPFPSVNGHPIASLGGSALMINAKSAHKQAAYALMNFLMEPQQQLGRALDAGDPPSVQAAYTPQLYASAPYFEQEKAVFDAVVTRPVLANYTEVSAAIQLMISQVLSNQKSPQAAAAQAASAIAGMKSSE